MGFGKRLQQLREQAGLSQSQLAHAIGMPVKSLQNWEAERVEPRLGGLVKLARGLGVSTDVLLGDGDAAAEAKPAKRKRGK
jgi:transcriptional regulator with XRE-family HTH domain